MQMIDAGCMYISMSSDNGRQTKRISCITANHNDIKSRTIIIFVGL